MHDSDTRQRARITAGPRRCDAFGRTLAMGIVLVVVAACSSEPFANSGHAEPGASEDASWDPTRTPDGGADGADATDSGPADASVDARTCTTAPARPTVGNTYYVATTGSDNAGCGTVGSPCLTIEYAYEHKVSAGDTILVKPGTFTGGGRHAGYGRVLLNKQGTAESPIIIRSETYHGAILDGGASATYPYYFYFEGSGGTGLASYNIVDGFVITNTYKSGITMWGDNNQVINNEIYNVGTNFQVNGDGGAGVYEDQESSGNYYGGNYIHGVPSHGLYLCGDNTTVVNNILASQDQFGLQIRGSGTVTNMKVYNNTFHSNTRSGIVIWQNMNGVEIKNNIFYQNQEVAISLWEATGSGVTIDNNVSYGNPEGNLISYVSTVSYTATNWNHNDPLFVDAAAEDFDLQSGSSAIDAGLTLSAATTDFDGIVRPQGAAYDIGAVESCRR